MEEEIEQRRAALTAKEAELDRRAAAMAAAEAELAATMQR